ncbi:hypothetical protein [Oceanirhabdus sp. W0125-5]|nr:hypothetical protein [Oceanirhabdus sp. W0125-5]WBW96207.1 hypothetical protein OW730_21315 [Oceanirhabdus sp. W0125-5]
MENFCYSYEDKKIKKELCSSINGRGDFLMLKEIIYEKWIDDK